MRPPDPGRPTWAEIDLGALLHNYRTLCGLLDCALQIADGGLAIEGTASGPNPKSTIRNPQSEIPNPQSAIGAPRLIPVIKANAYGHGAVPAARALAGVGARGFALTIVEEGAALREGGIEQEILVLEGCWPGQEKEALRYRLMPAVYSVSSIRRLAEAARAAGERVPVHLKIDTGMNRLGVPWNDMGAVLDALLASDSLRLRGTFSHLASAEEEDASFTLEQKRRFHQAVGLVRDRGLDPGELHLANSAGLLYHPGLRSMSARPGIALYGYFPDPERCPESLRPVLSLKSRIGQIRTVPPGASVGYNRLFAAERTTRAATLPVGYADGYRRSLTGKGWAIVRDRLVPVIGSVNMDMIVIDVTDFSEIQEGEEVILLGSSTHCRVDASAWACWLNTSAYEILCGISPRVPRVYPALGTSTA